MTPLTDRERQILEAYVEAESARKAAILLGISEQTVKNHLHAIRNKTGTATTLGALKALGWIVIP